MLPREMADLLHRLAEEPANPDLHMMPALSPFGLEDRMAEDWCDAKGTPLKPHRMRKTGRIWTRHVFVCTSGSWCPAVDGDGLGVHACFKRLVAEAGLKGQVRVNHSGCLDQCGHGPMVVIYPEAVWYWGVRVEDVEEIVHEHLVGGRPVKRLRYRNTPGKNKLPRDPEGTPLGRPRRSEHRCP